MRSLGLVNSARERRSGFARRGMQLAMTDRRKPRA
jgi:hypothetical protein